MAEPMGSAQVLEKLAKKGYTGDFRSSKLGLKIWPEGMSLDPEDLVVDAIYRFEGQTDLNDEEMIFAISVPKKNLKGTYLVAFGPMMDPIDSAMVLRLKKMHDSKKS